MRVVWLNPAHCDSRSAGKGGGEMSYRISKRGSRRPWLVGAGVVVAAVGLAVFVSAGSPAAARPNDFVYQVSPFVQPTDTPSSTNTFTSPFCSTRSGLPTLVC